MRRWLPYIFLALMLLTSSGLLVYANREKFIPTATLAILNQNEQSWYQTNISSYNLVIEISYAKEKREHSLSVVNNQIVKASMRYWDYERKDWGKSQVMGNNAAEDLAISGLFQTIRSELLGEFRKEIRVVYHQEKHYPEYIYLGTVVQESEIIPSSEARLRVVSFSPFQP